MPQPVPVGAFSFLLQTGFPTKFNSGPDLGRTNSTHSARTDECLIKTTVFFGSVEVGRSDELFLPLKNTKGHLFPCRLNFSDQIAFDWQDS